MSDGTEQLGRLAAQLKAASRGDLRRQLLHDIRGVTAPMIEAARESARETLPQSGGYADHVARSRITTRSRLTGSSASVRIEGPPRSLLREVDQGRLRHPTFGHDPWVTQPVRPGWWSEPMRRESTRVRTAVIHAVVEIGRKLHG